MCLQVVNYSNVICPAEVSNEKWRRLLPSIVTIILIPSEVNNDLKFRILFEPILY